jgi:hypothetical protein
MWNLLSCLATTNFSEKGFRFAYFYEAFGTFIEWYQDGWAVTLKILQTQILRTPSKSGSSNVNEVYRNSMQNETEIA